MMASAIATTSVAPEERSPIRNAARPHATTTTAGPKAMGESRRGRQMLGWLEDAGLSLLLVLALPLVILAVGAPVALVVWLVTEIGRR
jgi:hypothetical protein